MLTACLRFFSKAAFFLINDVAVASSESVVSEPWFIAIDNNWLRCNESCTPPDDAKRFVNVELRPPCMNWVTADMYKVPRICDSCASAAATSA